MTGIGGGHVAGSIARGNGRTHITVRCQHRSRHIHTPGFAIHIHRGLVGLGTDFYGDRIARFNVVIDFTGHRDGLAGFGCVNHVIGRDVINSNGRGWRNGVDAVSVIGIGGRDIASRIARGDSGTHITIRCQNSSRNIDAPGLAVGIHRCLVGLGTDFHHHRIARFDVVINLTGHRNGLAGFTGVNHII
ncbi:hypothetical protein PB72LOC_04004 [Pectobacterium atrosepticum]|nr:hypothetical protein PB72LOC_04004 [Pectobacterium atrosepticum]